MANKFKETVSEKPKKKKVKTYTIGAYTSEHDFERILNNAIDGHEKKGNPFRVHVKIKPSYRHNVNIDDIVEQVRSYIKDKAPTISGGNTSGKNLDIYVNYR